MTDTSQQTPPNTPSKGAQIAGATASGIGAISIVKIIRWQGHLHGLELDEGTATALSFFAIPVVHALGQQLSAINAAILRRINES